MSNSIDKLKEHDWFVTGYHTTSGRPHMESSLFDYAKRRLLHRLVFGDSLSYITKDLEGAQERRSAENPSWKKTRFDLHTGGHFGVDAPDTIWLTIGDSYFVLQRVEGEY